MHLKFSYICSAQGISKTVALVIGLLAASTGTYAVTMATYISNGEQLKCEGNKRHPIFPTTGVCADGRAMQCSIGMIWIVLVLTAIELITLLFVEVGVKYETPFTYCDIAISTVFLLISAVAGFFCVLYAQGIYDIVYNCDNLGWGFEEEFRQCTLNRTKMYRPLESYICGGFSLVNALAYFAALAGSREALYKVQITNIWKQQTAPDLDSDQTLGTSRDDLALPISRDDLMIPSSADSTTETVTTDDYFKL